MFELEVCVRGSSAFELWRKHWGKPNSFDYRKPNLWKQMVDETNRPKLAMWGPGWVDQVTGDEIDTFSR
jgi:hypothetical protein